MRCASSSPSPPVSRARTSTTRWYGKTSQRSHRSHARARFFFFPPRSPPKPHAPSHPYTAHTHNLQSPPHTSNAQRQRIITRCLGLTRLGMDGDDTFFRRVELPSSPRPPHTTREDGARSNRHQVLLSCRMTMMSCPLRSGAQQADPRHQGPDPLLRRRRAHRAVLRGRQLLGDREHPRQRRTMRSGGAEEVQVCPLGEGWFIWLLLL